MFRSSVLHSTHRIFSIFIRPSTRFLARLQALGDQSRNCIAIASSIIQAHALLLHGYCMVIVSFPFTLPCSIYSLVGLGLVIISGLLLSCAQWRLSTPPRPITKESVTFDRIHQTLNRVSAPPGRFAEGRLLCRSLIIAFDPSSQNYSFKSKSSLFPLPRCCTILVILKRPGNENEIEGPRKRLKRRYQL